jgi:hypothetical protein
MAVPMKTGDLGILWQLGSCKSNNQANSSNYWLVGMLFLIALFQGQFTGVLSQAHAHEFDDGHIERSIDAIMRGRNLEVRYAIGLSDETIVAWLVKEEALGTDEAARFRELIAEYETSDASEQTQSDEATEPVAFQTELSVLLKEKLSQRVSKKFSLTANQNLLEFEVAKVAASPRHHVAIEFVLKATLPVAETVELSFVDQNFLDAVSSSFQDGPVTPKRPSKEADSQTAEENGVVPDPTTQFQYSGNVRKACRVKGNAVQLSSNSVPVLTRAKPIDVSEMGLKERIEAGTIVTKIAFAKPVGR